MQIAPRSLKKAIVTQYDRSDCGAACVLSVLKFFERNVNLEEIKTLSGTTKNGTTFLGLQEAFHHYDIESEGYQAKIEDLKDQTSPAILHVHIDNMFDHYIVCYGYVKNKFLIVDPLDGFKGLSSEDLEKIWISNKMLLVENVLESTIQNRKDQTNWFFALFKKHIDKLLSALLLGFLISILTISTAFFTETIVDKYLVKNLFTETIEVIIVWAAMLICSELLTFARTRIIIRQVLDFNVALLGKYFSKLLKMDIHFFDSKEVGDLVSRMNDAEIVEETSTEVVSQTLIDLLIATIIVIYFLFFDVQLGIIIAGSVILYLGIAIQNNSTIIQLQRNVVIAHSKRESKFIDILNNIELIKSYNLEKRFTGSVSDQYEKFEKVKLILDDRINRYSTAINLIQLLTLLSSFVYLVLGVLNGEFAVGSLFATYILVSKFNASIKNMVILNVNIQGSLVSISRLRDFVTFKRGMTISEEKPIEFNSNQLTIEAKNISFKYPGSQPLIIEAQFHASINSITSIIGPNGSGKSTFLKLLKRFFYPNEGEILINSMDHSRIPNKQWQNLVIYIEQHPKIINGTVLENIALRGDINGNQVEEFLIDNNFHKFLKSLPNGVYTHIGLGGVPLSGGQKQIISIVRGLLQESKIILMDEPTSSIDEFNKANIINLLAKAKVRKSIIISSHDPDILKISDRKYKFEDKSIVSVM